MKKFFLAMGFTAMFVLIAIVAFSYGAKTGRAGVAAQLATTQAMLSFNHLQRYRELELDR